jgi:hypothetical protein
MVVAGITRQLVPLSMIAGRYLCVCVCVCVVCVYIYCCTILCVCTLVYCCAPGVCVCESVIHDRW